MPADDITLNWAPRVKQARILRLYRFAGMGIYDEDALQDVGTSLYARSVDIATVADAFQYGLVACHHCQMRVQRRIDPLYGLGWHGERGRWFHCPHCASRLLWTECRKALREKPRCFNCRTLMKGPEGPTAMQLRKGMGLQRHTTVPSDRACGFHALHAR